MFPVNNPEIWGRWPACERLGMCCVEKSPFSLAEGTICPQAPPTIPRPLPLRFPHAHEHAPFYQRSLRPHPHPNALSHANTPDNWQQLPWWAQSMSQGSSAGLTPHLTLAWPLACESSSPKAALPVAWHSLYLYLLSPHALIAPGQDTPPSTSASSGQPGQLNSNWE